MTDDAERLRAELLRLPTNDRAELAYCLIRSLDNEDDAETSVAWEVELERRWQDLGKRDDVDEELAAGGFLGRRTKGW